MKYSYPYKFGFFAGVLSTFDIGATIQTHNITPLAKGLEYDLQRLMDDQNALIRDYEKSTNKLKQELSNK